ncbi:unnamed protein product [Camellia sinensis]
MELITLTDLVIQGSGFDGPIPLEIASLTKMTDLRISDLNGIEATFQPLNNMKNMKTLLLRNLSFKKLNGEIPSNFENLSTVEFMNLSAGLYSLSNMEVVGHIIMFTDDKTYSNLGRRIFDIYIQQNHGLLSKLLQGKVEHKDFNIEKAVGGVNKETTQTFTVVVTNSTLEICLYWAGIGITSILIREVYGPLISAIFVDHVSKNENNISVGVVVGIVAAVAFVIILLLGTLWWRGYLLRKDTMEHDGFDLKIGSFTLRQLKAATNNFDVTNKIGESGFGSVYKEIVRNQLLLVYEYMENDSLACALFGLEECQLKLDWATRYKICIGIARGLAYLHEESRLKIVHRDINATNVLLDKNLNPKISDFGLAKLDEEDNTHISTRIALELKEKGKLMKLVDSKLGLYFIEKEVIVMINVAILCTNVTPTIIPTMSSVVSMLEGRAVVEELVSDSTIFNHKMAVKGMTVNL